MRPRPASSWAISCSVAGHLEDADVRRHGVLHRSLCELLRAPRARRHLRGAAAPFAAAHDARRVSPARVHALHRLPGVPAFLCVFVREGMGGWVAGWVVVCFFISVCCVFVRACVTLVLLRCRRGRGRRRMRRRVRCMCDFLCSSEHYLASSCGGRRRRARRRGAAEATRLSTRRSRRRSHIRHSRRVSIMRNGRGRWRLRRPHPSRCRLQPFPALRARRLRRRRRMLQRPARVPARAREHRAAMELAMRRLGRWMALVAHRPRRCRPLSPPGSIAMLRRHRAVGASCDTTSRRRHARRPARARARASYYNARAASRGAHVIAPRRWPPATGRRSG